MTDHVPSAIDHAASVLGKRAQRRVPLGPFTTYGVGGPAALFVEVGTDADLRLVQEAVSSSGVDALVIGRGSNLLVSDDGFDGLALVLRDSFAWIDIAGTTATAGGATALPVLARRTAAAALSGLEWAVGVPGSVGGAVRMNAGGHGSDVSRTLQSVRLLDLAVPHAPEVEVKADALGLSYRHSSVGRHQVVTSARFGLQTGDRAVSERQIADIVRWRRTHQPGGSNAGSVFTNPPGDSAGRLVEEAGLKGLRIGSATVSARHANFFQVEDGGSAADVLALMETVSRQVLERTGVQLRPEVHFIGFHHAQPEVER